MYQRIDQSKTGIKLKKMLNAAGYDVKDLQEYLQLSCPQSIYRWFKGKALPSVEHLCAISRLLHVHVDDLLVMQGETAYCGASHSESRLADRLSRYACLLECGRASL